MNRSDTSGFNSGPFQPFGAATQTARRPLSVEPPDGDFDALRDLFLDGEPLGPIHAPLRPVAAVTPFTPAPVEGLILGHLPVYGPAWVGQYTRSVAEEVGGVVGLIGLRAGQTTLDLFGPGIEPTAESDSLADAISAAAPLVARWMVRVDEPTEPLLAESSRLTRITLLTGVDEAAVVACYRTLKRLIRESDEGEPIGPTVRLAVMGAGPERAGPAADKLSRAAQTFLGRRVESAACLSKISPGRSITLFRGQSETSLDGLLDLISRAAAAPRPASVSISSPAPTQTPAPAPPPAGVPAPLAAAQPIQISNSQPPQVDAPEPSAPPASAPAAPSVSSPVSPAMDTLTSRIGGLHPLQARCPHAPEVELAFDSSGILHLLAVAPEAAGGEDRALSMLTAASAWAESHLPLLALTAPRSHLLTTGAHPVLHLATRNAPSVRRLLDTNVRIHAVATVEIEGRRGVVCVALN